MLQVYNIMIIVAIELERPLYKWLKSLVIVSLKELKNCKISLKLILNFYLSNLASLHTKSLHLLEKNNWEIYPRRSVDHSTLLDELITDALSLTHTTLGKLFIDIIAYYGYIIISHDVNQKVMKFLVNFASYTFVLLPLSSIVSKHRLVFQPKYKEKI